MDNLLAVKHNQSQCRQEVIAALADAERGAFAPEAEDRCQTLERNRGHTDRS